QKISWKLGKYLSSWPGKKVDSSGKIPTMPPHSSYLKFRREPKKFRGSYENSQVLDLGRRWTYLGKFQLCHRIPHTYSLKQKFKKMCQKISKKKVKTKCTWLLKKYGFGFFGIYPPGIAKIHSGGKADPSEKELFFFFFF